MMKKKDANRIKLVLQEWHDSHPAEYADFKRTVDSAMEDGDMTLFLRNIIILKNAQPKGLLGKIDRIVDIFVFTKDEREKMKTGKVDADTPSGSMSFIDMLYTAAYTLRHKDKVAVSLAETKPDQLWCMYYWLFFENGANKLTTMLSQNNYSEKHSWWLRPVIKMAVRSMVKNSVKNLMSSKESWNKTIKGEPDEEIKEEIASVLAVTKGTGQGRTERNDDLENMLIGDKEKLVAEIEFFVRNRKHDSQLGYIFFFLIMARCIEPNKYDYMTFHRAIIRKFPDASIKGYDRSQALYSKLMNIKKESDLSTRAANEYEAMKKQMLVKFIEAK